MSSWTTAFLGAGTAAAGLALLRQLRKPPRPRWDAPPLPPAQADCLRAAVAVERFDLAELPGRLAAAQVLLIGEAHRWREPIAAFLQLLAQLHQLDGRRAVLLLELPARVQPHLDRYLATGDDQALAPIWPPGAPAALLGYDAIARFARARPEVVRALVADDRDEAGQRLDRLLLRDRRNGVMTATLLAARARFPEDRLVAYGGAWHLMRAGRAPHDHPDYEPVGQRLLASGLPPAALASVWIAGTDAAVVAAFAAPGVASTLGALGTLPVAHLSGALHGVARLAELHDFVVHLGPLTPTGRARAGRVPSSP